MTSSAPNLGYTQACEYATTMVVDFLNREKLLDKKDEDRVYGDGVIKTLFTNDYSLVKLKSVREKIESFLEKENVSPVRHRLRSLYTAMYVFLGRETATEIKRNMLVGLAASANANDGEAYDEFFKKHPELVPVVLAQTTYASRLLLARRGSQTTNTVRANP